MYARPIEDYRVHFSGRLLSDIEQPSISGVIFEKDKTGEILGIGRYPYIREALKQSVEHTFDGIAIDSKTRLIIYSGENFQGEVLLDVTGPAVINNSLWMGHDYEYGYPNSKTYTSYLQSKFPQESRRWSDSDMHGWQSGSLVIMEVQ